MDESVCNYDFSFLPPHIMAQVFTNLKFRDRLRAAQTCKSWYFASCDPIISRNICVSIGHHTRLCHLDNFNRPFGKLILSIDFDKFNYCDFFEKFGQHVHTVFFNYCELSLEQLIDCLGYLTNLSSIEFDGRRELFAVPNSSALNNNEMIVKVLIRNLRPIKNFRINSSNLGGLGIIMFRMVNLETIEYITGQLEFEPALIDYIKQFDDLKLRCLEVGYEVGAKFFHSFAEVKTKVNLHTLKIHRIHDDYYDSSFEIFCKKLSNLRVLSTTITENQLIDVCRYMTNLVELELSILNTRTFFYIRTLQTLKKLVITSDIYRDQEANDEELIQLLSVPLVNLQQLEITHCMSLTVLEVLCENYKHLNRLKLSGLKTFNIDAIYKNFVNLKSLDIYFYVYPIPELNVNSSYDITNLTLLEDLDINKSVPGATWDLIKQLPNLKPVSLETLLLKFNSGYVDPYDEGTFRMMLNLFD